MSGALLLGVFSGFNVAIIALGVVLIFKSGKYINFAQAQLGIVPMMILGKVVIDWGASWYVAFPLALILGALIGVACEAAIVRPLSKLGPQVVLVGTIGIAQLLLGVAYVKSISATQRDLISLGYPVPFDAKFQLGGATFFAQHIMTLIVVPVVAIMLWLFLSHTLTGKSIRASSCNEEAALLAGVNIRRLSMSAWGIAGVLATIGAVLSAPNSPGFDPSSVGPTLMFSALGAAALAGFSSFPQAVLAAVMLSALQSGVVYRTSDTSKGVLALFVATLVGLILRRNSDALRETVTTLRGALIRPGMSPTFRSQPAGRTASRVFPAVLVGIGVVAMLLVRDDPVKLFRLDQILIVCAVAVSVSLLGGLSGQMSLGQAAFMGVGAVIASRLVYEGSTSLIVNIVVCSLVTAVVAALVSLPSIRGGALIPAVTTLGFGVLASSWLFNQKWLVKGGSGFGGGASTEPMTLPIFGAVNSQIAIFWTIFAVVAVLVAAAIGLQRSQIGLRMSAVRFNESGARAMGVNVYVTRVLASACAGAIAGAAGVLSVSANAGLVPTTYNTQLSLVLVAIVVIGGLGSLTGAVVSAVLIYGAPLFLTDWINGWGGNPVQVQLLLGGAALVVNLMLNPGGLATAGAMMLERILRRSGAPKDAPMPISTPVPRGAAAPQEPRRSAATSVATLATTEVSRSFGVVRALSDVTIRVGEHEIVGLIGNNGAGKTTLLNCIAGDLRHEGTVDLYGESVSSLGPMRRARIGLGRTFQNADLFAGLTTREVLRLAADNRANAGSQDDPAFDADVVTDETLADLDLQEFATTLTSDLPTGIKRTVELGIQVIRRPGVILLDEPAAGLSQFEVEQFGPRLRQIVDRLGCSVLMIEHDLPLMLGIADRIYCLELGIVIAEGTPAEIRSNPAVIESYFGSPTGVGARRSEVLVGAMQSHKNTNTTEETNVT